MDTLIMSLHYSFGSVLYCTAMSVILMNDVLFGTPCVTHPLVIYEALLYYKLYHLCLFVSTQVSLFCHSVA